MKGTSASHTLAIDLIPPRITKAVSTAIAMPVIHGATRNVSFTIAEMEFACTIFPMPNADTAVRMAKITPSHFCFMPLSRTYIGPPAINPSFVFYAVFNGKECLGVLCGDAEDTCQPHPEHSSWTTGRDSRRNTDDVTGAYGGGQCSG